MFCKVCKVRSGCRAKPAEKGFIQGKSKTRVKFARALDAHSQQNFIWRIPKKDVKRLFSLSSSKLSSSRREVRNKSMFILLVLHMLYFIANYVAVT